MKRDANADLSIFDTRQFLVLTQMKRHQLQTLERFDVVHPIKPGRVGRGGGARWSFIQAVAVEYYRAFTAAGMHASWAAAAAKWVQRQNIWDLANDLKAGKTLLSLTPDGEGHLVEPKPKPDANRDTRIKLAQLDLGRAFLRMLRRGLDLTGQMVIDAGWSLDDVNKLLDEYEA
jgi:hypothetical protein